MPRYITVQQILIRKLRVENRGQTKIGQCIGLPFILSPYPNIIMYPIIGHRNKYKLKQHSVLCKTQIVTKSGFYDKIKLYVNTLLCLKCVRKDTRVHTASIYTYIHTLTNKQNY